MPPPSDERTGNNSALDPTSISAIVTGAPYEGTARDPKHPANPPDEEASTKAAQDSEIQKGGSLNPVLHQTHDGPTQTVPVDEILNSQKNDGLDPDPSQKHDGATQKVPVDDILNSQKNDGVNPPPSQKHDDPTQKVPVDDILNFQKPDPENPKPTETHDGPPKEVPVDPLLNFQTETHERPRSKSAPSEISDAPDWSDNSSSESLPVASVPSSSRRPGRSNTLGPEEKQRVKTTRRSRTPRRQVKRYDSHNSSNYLGKSPSPNGLRYVRILRAFHTLIIFVIPVTMGNVSPLGRYGLQSRFFFYGWHISSVSIRKIVDRPNSTAEIILAKSRVCIGRMDVTYGGTSIFGALCMFSFRNPLPPVLEPFAMCPSQRVVLRAKRVLFFLDITTGHLSGGRITLDVSGGISVTLFIRVGHIATNTQFSPEIGNGPPLPPPKLTGTLPGA